MSLHRHRYGRAASALHWAIAILFLAATGLALFRETFERGAVAMITVHKAVGLAILALVLIRLILPLGRPPPPPGRPWERGVARTVHRLLYALLILVPASGWIFVSLAPDSRPLDYRGGAGVPELPLGQDDAASFNWHEVHELTGFLMLGLFAIHLIGFLRHQLRPGDAVLGRMLAGSRAWDWLALLALLVLIVWAVGLALDILDLRLWR